MHARQCARARFRSAPGALARAARAVSLALGAPFGARLHPWLDTIGQCPHNCINSGEDRHSAALRRAGAVLWPGPPCTSGGSRSGLLWVGCAHPTPKSLLADEAQRRGDNNRTPPHFILPCAPATFRGASHTVATADPTPPGPPNTFAAAPPLRAHTPHFPQSKNKPILVTAQIVPLLADGGLGEGQAAWRPASHRRPQWLHRSCRRCC